MSTRHQPVARPQGVHVSGHAAVRPRKVNPVAPTKGGLHQMQRLLRFGLALALALCCLWAQTPTATLQGIIGDPWDAVVPEAKVTVTNVATGVSRVVTTDVSGRCVQPFLLPGLYSITVEKAGFQTLRQENVRLDVGQNRSVDLTLSVGAVTQEVRVEAAPPVVDVNTSAVGQVVDTKRILELPLLGRNVFALGASPQRSTRPEAARRPAWAAAGTRSARFRSTAPPTSLRKTTSASTAASTPRRWTRSRSSPFR